MNRRSLVGLPLVAFTVVLGREARAATSIVVVVNKNNPVSKLTVADLAAIFMTKRLHWSDNERILAFNAPAKNAVRVAFDREVLGMDQDEVARYWIDRRVRGGHRPPRQLNSWVLMLKVVSAVDGAIGYVPESSMSDQVKALLKVEA